MDVVGSIGYIGQQISFLDAERFAYVSGKSLCLHEITKGPRDILWQNEDGVGFFCVNSKIQLMAIAPVVHGSRIDVVSSDNFTLKFSIENPTDVAIMYMAFSAVGDKLIALSDHADHRVLVWNIGSSSAELILSDKLEASYRECCFDPTSSDSFCMYGYDNISIGTIRNILGTFSLAIDPIPLTGNHLPSDDSLQGFQIVLWLPLKRLLVGNGQGSFFEVRCDSKVSRFLGKFAADRQQQHQSAAQKKAFLVPTQAKLFVNSIVLITGGGVVYWFPVINLLSLENGNPIFDFSRMQQLSTLGMPISWITGDPNNMSLLVGSYDGEIFKLPVDITEQNMSNFEEKTDLDQELGSPAMQEIVIEDVAPQAMGTEIKQGIVLCSKSLFINVEKFSGKSKSSLTMLITGNHSGTLSFWRQPLHAVEPMTIGGGVRRSTPRALKSIFTLPSYQASKERQNVAPAVCSIESLPLANKTSCLLFIGLENGWLEVWSFEAFEHEEEDMRDNSEDSLRLVEDDEGGCLVRIEAQKIFDIKLFSSALSLIAITPIFSTKEGVNNVACAFASSSDSRMYVQSVLQDDQLSLGSTGLDFDQITIENDDTPTSVNFISNNLSSDSHPMTIVTGLSGNVYVFSAAIKASSETSQIPLRKISSGLPVLTQMVASSYNSNMVYLDNSKKVYFLEPGALANLAADSTLIEPIIHHENCKVLEHDDIAVCCTHAFNGKYFVVGCANGTISIWKTDSEPGEVTLANTLSLHQGGIVSLAITADSSFLLASATDGAIFVISLDKGSSPTKGAIRQAMMKPTSLARQSSSLTEHKAKVVAPTGDDQPPSEVTWAEQKELDKSKELKAQYKFKMLGIGAAISDISSRLDAMLHRNEKMTDLEKLELSEFVVDTVRKDLLLAANAQAVNQTQNMYAERNTHNELLAARVRMKCHDPMEKQASYLLPFAQRGTDLQVSSFSIAKYTADQTDLLSKIKRQRAVEIRTLKAENLGTIKRIPGTGSSLPGGGVYRCAWTTAINGCPPTLSWIFNDGTRWPVYENISDLLSSVSLTVEKSDAKDKAVDATSSLSLEEEEDGSMVSMEDEKELDENVVLNLLYPPQAVRSQVQKRSQVVLLKDVVRELQAKFNAHFDKLHHEKEDVIGAIHSRNTRIRAILEELHQQEDLFSPKLSNLELVDSAVSVSDEELQSRPYESEAARLMRLAAEEEKRRQEMERSKEDVKGRALDEMMHGTLEIKRDVFAEASSLQKPDWLTGDTIPSATDLTESQAKELDIYLDKLKTLQEEQAAYRKTLELEMKKLKNEIADLSKSFDDKLEEMAKLKVLVNREILSHELYISKVASNMVNMEQTRKAMKKAENEIHSLRKDKTELSSMISRFNLSFEEKKYALGVIQEEERQAEKTFKRDLQNLCNTTFSQPDLMIFTQLYRQRTYPRSPVVDDVGDATGMYNQSAMDASASATNNMMASKAKSKNSKSQARSRAPGKKGGLSSSNAKGMSKMKASRGAAGVGGNGASASAGGSDGNSHLGPMQLAAQALKSSEDVHNYSDRDPYTEALYLEEKRKLIRAAQVPLTNTLNMEQDCPPDFDVDQFFWSKLQELRSAKIEKEIAAKHLAFELADLKAKLEILDSEEIALVGKINEARAERDAAMNTFRDLSANLDIVVCLRQGQDEIDKDAVATDYSAGLLLPADVVGKFNTRIKELGKEKISVLTKIKQFRRKINMIDWETSHHDLEANHYEQYFTDLQLFRVTRELQKVIRDGADVNQSKVKTVTFLYRSICC